MKLENLVKPIWLINKDFKRKEEVHHLHYLDVATKLSLKENALEGCFLIDANNQIGQIKSVADVGSFNPWWRFEFFNPMRKIDLVIEEITDKKTKEKIISIKNMEE